MLRRAQIALIAVLAAVSAGCVSVRTTTTPRTALEQALLSEAAGRTLEAFEIPAGGDKTYSLDTGTYNSLDKEFILGALNNALLQAGYRAAKAPAEANLLVFPRAAYVGTDDSTFLIGIPSFQLPFVVVAGGFTTPEIALFKIDRRFGRTRLALHTIDRESGKLEFELPLEAAQATYKLYTVLLFIHFRTTDLPAPH